MTSNVTRAVIPGSGYISAGVALATPGLLAIEIDGPWNAAPFSFQVSSDDQATWQDAFLDGNEFLTTIQAGSRLQLDSELWEGVTDVKARSGSALSPVVQPVDTTVLFITPGTHVPPPITPLPCNPFRIIHFSAILQSGVLPPYYVGDNSIATFDLAGLLKRGELLTGIVSFSLIPEGPSPKNLDTTPSARILRGPEISGSLVNVELGNWQTDPVLVQYAAKLVFSTNYEPAQTVLGIVQVIQLAPYPQDPPCIGCGVLFPIFPMWWDY